MEDHRNTTTTPLILAVQFCPHYTLASGLPLIEASVEVANKQ